jgi:hypothetical protein
LRRFGIVAGASFAIILVSSLFAASGIANQRTVRTAFIRVHASNGYRASVSALRQLRPKRHAELSVVVRKDDAYAFYRTRALFTKRRLRARLGPFGRVNLRYDIHRRAAAPEGQDPSREQRPAKLARETVCVGTGSAHAETFKGRIHFDGENGYTRIRARRARGWGGTDSFKCSRGGGGHRVAGTVLTAKSGALEFEAERFRRFGDERFLYAQEEKRVGAVRVVREASNYRNAVFDFSRDLTSAHVEPSGAPFSGSADYASPDQWTGDLSVSFPGEPDVALTGPDFTARLRHVGG